MGALLKFIFYSLAFTWIYRNLILPMFQPNKPQAPPPSYRQNDQYGAQDVSIKPKSKNKGDEGEYIDYEEIKQ
jgi:hypothetical protein